MARCGTTELHWLTRYCDFLNISTVQDHLKSTLTALPDSWVFSPHMLPSQRRRTGFQDSQDRRSPCTPALRGFPIFFEKCGKNYSQLPNRSRMSGAIMAQKKQKELRNIFQGTVMSGRRRWSLSSRRTLLGSWQKAKTSSTGPTAGSGYLATSKLGASLMGLSKWVGQSFTEYERENKLLLSHPNWQRSGGGGCTSCFFAAVLSCYS